MELEPSLADVDSSGRAQGRARRAARTIAVLVLLGLLIASAWRAWPGFDRWLRTWRAERAIAEGRLDQARAGLEILLVNDPLATRPRLLLAQVARRQGRITEAEETLQRAVELGLPVEQGRRERALIRAGHDFARAEPLLRRALESDPNDAEVRQALAEGPVARR
jgi:cytochrome c-type biogenesis protein CcmH/NrfG